MLKDGKLFGKVNIVDIAVLLIIIIAVFGVYVRFKGSGAKTTASNTEFYADILVHNIRESNVVALEKSIGLEFVTDEKSSIDFGSLTKVKKSPANAIIEKDNGEVVNTIVPDRYDVMLTFKFSGKVNDVGYYNSVLKEVGAGATYTIRSKWASVYGIAQNVWQEGK